jgi:uncharacterized protein (DUF302 family)
MSEPLAYRVELSVPYEDAVDRVIEALKAEGFGVLTRIDVKETIKAKLGEDFRPYVILGACNPPLAHRALSEDAGIGVMLPCNVTVEAQDGDALVALANPVAMMTMGEFGENAELVSVAYEAQARIKRVIEALRTDS